MAENKIPTIYRFPNATLISWNGVGFSGESVALFESGEPVALEPGILSDEVRDRLGSYNYRLHSATEGELELVKSIWSQELVSYIPLQKDSLTEDQSLRELSEATYEKLSPGFRSLYRKKLADPVETRVVIEHELKVVDYELREAVLLGKEYPSELHRIITPLRERENRSRSYGWSSNGPRPQLSYNLSLSLSGEELLRAVTSLGTTAIPSQGYSASVGSSSYGAPEHISIDFYERPYDGSTRKILDKKQNGQPYADRRGRFVKDLPTAVGSAKIKRDQISSWWSSIDGENLSDGSKIEALKLLTKHLWRVQE